MFYSIKGTVVHLEDGMAAVECGGVAYACSTTANTLGKLALGEQAALYTHLNVREDAVELFGFATREELDCFRKLVGVTGVGPKAALAVLSAFTPEQLGFFIATGDSKGITRAQGVGPKLAQRMVLELKDKLTSYPAGGIKSHGGADFTGNGVPGGEALEALLALGYAPAEAALALRGLQDGLTTQEKIRQALKTLSD
ncbi:MAG: Holliday junction branch migration protein RuvA [Oscillospiraceae bacterium]|jgi:Holliday junction DNA helicase RuvA|nr:Holliday junction branch migration protein RuvA [Oscillospiraceae bacterium]